MAESEVAEVPVPTTPVLDVEEVRAKLLAIIDANPEKSGAPPKLLSSNEKGCYYFLNAHDYPIWDKVPREEIAAPCCIVGHFFFDTAALDAEPLLTGMMENQFIGWILRSEEPAFNKNGNRDGSRSVTPPVPITPDAVKLLSFAQTFQDESAKSGNTWAHIRDDIANWTIWNAGAEV